MAVVESTESANRLEGVVAPIRLKLLVLKNAAPKSHSEQEVAGYHVPRLPAVAVVSASQRRRFMRVCLVESFT